MAQSNELTEQLFTAVDTIIGERISSLPYDQTIVCKIVDAKDSANGIYVVSHDFDTTFTAYADYTGFHVEDNVYVRIPEGDYTKQKVITGKYLEGILLAGETQNIEIIGNQSYLLYDKNNQIHSYNWCKEERELVFRYYNSAKPQQRWYEVLNTFSNYSMSYERANGIKLIINSEEDIVVYFYKYLTSDNVPSIAAEQYGVTSPTLIPDILQTKAEKPSRFIQIAPKDIFLTVDQTKQQFSDSITYYTLEDKTYTVADITEFDSTVTYYLIPTNLKLYQDDAITADSLIEDFIPVEHRNLDFNKPIWYYTTNYIELDFSNTNISMIKTARIFYEEDWNRTGALHLIYTLAPELNTQNANIPITIQYCPAGETTNIRATTNLGFGYITELSDEINIDLYLKRHTNNGTEETVPAMIVGDTSQYYLQVLLTDKFGNKLDNSYFKYKWDGTQSDNSQGIYRLESITQMPDEGRVIKLEVCIYNTENINSDLVVYRTYYYPLAYSTSELYYIQGPDVIIYDEAGANPSYYDGAIQLLSYDGRELEQILETVENDLYTISLQPPIMRVYNIYKGTNEISCFKLAQYNELTETTQVCWLQSLYFTKKERQEYIQVKNYQEQQNSAHGYPGALAAQATSSAGLAIDYTSSVLSIEQYNNNVNSADPIFYANSSGGLKIGYDNFIMTGHISEGARYLENNLNDPIQQGSLLKPVYFTSAGVPNMIGTAILNTSAVAPDDDVGTYKIVPQLATSRIEQIINKNIDNADNAKFFIMTSAGAVNLGSGVAGGTEFELMWFGSDTNTCATLQGSGTTLLTVDNASDNLNNNNTITISEKGGVVAAKYLGLIGNSGPYWIITGTID